MVDFVLAVASTDAFDVVTGSGTLRIGNHDHSNLMSVLYLPDRVSFLVEEIGGGFHLAGGAAEYGHRRQR